MFVRTMETLAGGVGVFDPVDVRQPVVRVPALTAAQVTGIYDADGRGFAVWRRTPAPERAKVLARAGGLLRERAGEIALGVATENGGTLREARGEVEKAADFLDYYAGDAREADGSLVHDVRPDTRKDSGSAFKEQGVEPLTFYTRVKTVVIHFGR
jgi:acyl-CoA reductase-like NAD-dependent aldehyde dehydrogenase